MSNGHDEHAPGRDVPGTPPGGRREPRRSLPRFYGLTAAGTVLPGAGLLGTRRRRLGAVVLAGVVVLVAAVAWRAGSGGALHTVLDLAVRPNALAVVGAAVVVVALVWTATIVLTAYLSAPTGLPRGQRFATRGFTALMCLLIALPAAQAVRYLAIQRSVVGTVFTPSAGGTTGTAEPTAGTAEDPWAGVPRVNLLLLGSDAGTDRTGVRTDSMMVASIDTHTGDTVLIGVPRNLEKVPIPADNPLHALYPQGYDCGDQCLMNSIWTLATDHADLFPGNPSPGLTSTQQVLDEVLGLTIDHTVIIDLSGFQSLVDAMGGVDINAKERVPIGGKVVNGKVVGIDGWIDPGLQHMNGYHALWYARSRATTDDFSRMRRQRCVTGALLNQVNPVTMLQRYPDLAQVAKDHVSADIPQTDLPAWVTLVERIQQGTIRSLTLTNRVIDVTNPDYAKIHELVAQAMTSQAASTTSTASSAATTSGSPGATAGSPGATSAPTSGPSTPSPTTSDPTDTLTPIAAAC